MVEQKVTTPNVGIPWISVDTKTGADLPSSTPIPKSNTPVNYDTSFWSKDNIGVPWVNMPIWGTTWWTGETTEWWNVNKTVEPTPSWDSTDEALRKQKELIDKQNSELEANKNKLTEDLKTDNEKYLADLEKAKTEQIKAQEDASQRIKELEDSETARAKKIIDEQNAQMIREKEAAVADLEASKAQQRLVDEENIRQHKITVEVERQQSAWAFNKLWLAFSSWIILQSQKIAQDWAYQIARLKSDLVKNQTSIEKDIIQVQNDYTSMVNDNINKYNDLVADFKRSAIDRINTITLNKLANSEDLLKEKKSIADDFRKTITDLEAQFRNDQRVLADDAVKNAEAIRINSDRIKNERLEKLGWELASWNLSRMSATDIAKLEQELWLSQWEIQSKVTTWITSAIRGELDKIAWKDYYPENMNELVRKVNEEMKAWRDFQTALNTVMSREKTSNPNIKKAVEEKKVKDNLDAEKLKLEREKFEFSKTVTSSEFEEEYGTPLSISDWRVTQNYWATSPNSKDNVLLANGKTWTPWLDLAMAENTPIKSNINWTVVSVWNKWDYWNQVVVKDEQWNLHMYNHLNTSNVKVWDTISAWQSIALSWNTWFSTWPHLDYRVKWADWKWQDPNTFIQPKSVLELDDIELKSTLDWIQSSKDLKIFATENWIEFKDDNNNDILRANIYSAIQWTKAKIEDEKTKNAEVVKESIKKWIPIQEDELVAGLKLITPEIDRISDLSKKIKSNTDRFIDSWWLINFNPLAFTIKGIMNNIKISNKEKEWLIKSYWEQNRAVEEIKSIIEAIEDNITTSETKWNADTLKEIRRRYIAPILSKRWIKFNEEKWQFYIDWIKDFYID